MLPVEQAAAADRGGRDNLGGQRKAEIAGRRRAAACRAAAEAAERRAMADREAAARPQERHGRGGLEPVRYGDWEVNGIATDF